MNKRNEKKLHEKVKGKQTDSEEEKNTLDTFKDQKFVDDIPMEDLKIETEQETKKEQSQNTSQSERKHKTGFNNND